MSDKLTRSKPSDPRLRKACDRCHAQKLGCQRSSGARKCDRCTKAGKPCTWSISLRNRRNSIRLDNCKSQPAINEKSQEQNEDAQDDEQDDTTSGIASMTSSETVSTTIPATTSAHLSTPTGSWNQDFVSSSPMLMGIFPSIGSRPYTHSSIDANINYDAIELEEALPAFSNSESYQNLYGNTASPSGLATPILTNKSSWLDKYDENLNAGATPTAVDFADMLPSTLDEFQALDATTRTLDPVPEAEFSQNGTDGGHRRWLLKIIDINVQLFNHLQTSTGPSGPLLNRDQPGDRYDANSSTSALDNAIGLSMQFFNLLGELSEIYGEDQDGCTAPHDPNIPRSGRGSIRPLDPGSVLMILSSYIRVLEALSELLPAVGHPPEDSTLFHQRLGLPMITVGATMLNPHPRLCLSVFLVTLEQMLGSMSEHLACIVRATVRSPRPGESWRPGASLEHSLRDFRMREGYILKVIAGIRAKMGTKKETY